MNQKEIIKAVLSLIDAQNASEVTKILKSNAFFTNSEWWPYGSTESNFSVISAQAKDSVNALVEKIVNSIDALLLGECLKKGIDPKSPDAPNSMSEAVDKFFDIPGADISSLSTKERRALANNIQVVVDGDKEKPNITIVDLGEGQNPEDFLKTFLSLPAEKSNKADINFVQGKYNMGGTGALMFCGKPEERYQLVLSKRNPSISNSNKLWGFTLVRQTFKEGSRNPLFEYLVDSAGDFYFFDADTLQILPDEKKLYFGSFIKLYSYHLKRPSVATLDLWRPLNRRLFTPALPILIHEARPAYKGHSSSKVMEGNKFRLNGEDHVWVEKYFEIKSDLASLGNCTIEVTLFKDQIEESTKSGPKKRPFPNEEFTSPTEAIFLTVNGQTHHTIGRSTLETQANLRNLAKYLMVHIDVTDVGPVLSEIFHGAREGARDNEMYNEIQDRLLSDLKDNPLLRSLDEEYRRREIAKIQPDKGFIKQTAARILNENPDWVKRLFKGSEITLNTVLGKPQKFVPSYIPTIFELKGSTVKVVPINNKYSWIYFLTDAPDDYFTRKSDYGELKIESSVPVEKAYWLNEGLLSLKIITPINVTNSSQIIIKVILTIPGGKDFERKVVIQFKKETVREGGPSRPRKPVSGDLGLPEPDFVGRERWSEFSPTWGGVDIALVKGAVIQINVDSFDLHGFLSKFGKKYTEKSITEAYKTAIYLYSFIIDNELSDKDNEELIVLDNKDRLVSKIMQSIAKIVLPLNFEEFLQEVS